MLFYGRHVTCSHTCTVHVHAHEHCVCVWQMMKPENRQPLQGRSISAAVAVVKTTKSLALADTHAGVRRHLMITLMMQARQKHSAPASQLE